jgi:hypothetical protein
MITTLLFSAKQFSGPYGIGIFRVAGCAAINPETCLQDAIANRNDRPFLRIDSLS